jgi:ethanolamine ammonia-lyase small subunit
VNHRIANPVRLVTPTPWDALRQFTSARIALGRAGVSLPTNAHLAFQLAHAQARDAVHLPLDATGIQASLRALGPTALLFHSQACDRATYLQRPDLGRRLDAGSLQTLAQWRAKSQPGSTAASHPESAAFDLAFVVVDGLSALAIHQNAVPLVSAMLKRLKNDSTQVWRIAPLSVVEQGRVAIGDEVGAALNASMVVVLVGERPGLSSPDSLGLYLTWSPCVGKLDAQRNCISNVRPAGLSIETAAQTLHRLLTQARFKQLSGVGLKDDADGTIAPQASESLASYGIHPLPKRGGILTNELINRLRNAEGI